VVGLLGGSISHPAQASTNGKIARGHKKQNNHGADAEAHDRRFAGTLVLAEGGLFPFNVRFSTSETELVPSRCFARLAALVAPKQGKRVFAQTEPFHSQESAHP
jgi:hypothetical protein